MLLRLPEGKKAPAQLPDMGTGSTDARDKTGKRSPERSDNLPQGPPMPHLELSSPPIASISKLHVGSLSSDPRVPRISQCQVPTWSGNRRGRTQEGVCTLGLDRFLSK